MFYTEIKIQNITIRKSINLSSINRQVVARVVFDAWQDTLSNQHIKALKGYLPELSEVNFGAQLTVKPSSVFNASESRKSS